MEAAVLIGLMGAGYLLNKDKDENNNVSLDVNKQINFPSMNNTYDSTYIQDVDKMVRTLAEDNFEASYKPSNIVNNQKVINNTGLNVDTKNLEDYTYSAAADGFINNVEFMSDDRGVTIEPFFHGSGGANTNFDDARQLDRCQGVIEGNTSKRELCGNAFTDDGKNLTNIHGHQGEHLNDTSRYVPGTMRNHEQPFQQELIAPIDFKSNYNREIGELIAQKSNIDNLRTIGNQKLSYDGKILAGKGIEHRGKEGNVYKHLPEKFFDNNPDKWFVTTGAFLAKSERPEQMITDTNRTYFNKGAFGPAAPTVQENGALRGNYKKTLRQQLGSDTQRNAGSEVPLISSDLQKGGFRNVPNERQVTELRTYDSNLTTEVGNQVLGIQDEIKKTLKQTTIDSANNGYLGNNIDASTQRQYDSVKVTKKQTTIDSANNGYLTGTAEFTQKPYDRPEWTTKDSTMFDYTGNAGAYVKGDMNQNNFMNAETNPTKEIIAQGRAPTINNTKIANGMDTINMDIKKMDHDYMNHRLNGVDKVYGEIPTDNTCKFTTNKDRLDDSSIANRIDPSLLDPFKQNPYTQSLSSFAY